ncbi:xylosyltransferase oxt [Nematostella vectensis]|uniref:xylosyltransferase oxt n=1 Tax=Nematostella vectensis TaxID=45351 RepID=UPI002077630E|nr:xylosyltransferase oxt [Nematostella vectensis]
MKSLNLTLFLLVLIGCREVISEECSDALKREVGLCARWQANNLCAKNEHVQIMCAETCRLCGEHAKRSPPDYVGCFTDKRSTGFKMVFPRTALSVQSCVDHCLKRRYALAALQNGMFCMCGNDHKSMTPLAKRDGCNKMCGGTNEACGGFLQSSIYKTARSKSKRGLDRDSVEELILGKDVVTGLRARKREPKKEMRLPLKIPEKRNWKFDQWLRNYVRRQQ